MEEFVNFLDYMGLWNPVEIFLELLGHALDLISLETRYGDKYGESSQCCGLIARENGWNVDHSNLGLNIDEIFLFRKGFSVCQYFQREFGIASSIKYIFWISYNCMAEIKSWSNLTHHHIAEVVAQAFIWSITMSTASNAFNGYEIIL